MEKLICQLEKNYRLSYLKKLFSIELKNNQVSCLICNLVIYKIIKILCLSKRFAVCYSATVSKIYPSKYRGINRDYSKNSLLRLFYSIFLTEKKKVTDEYVNNLFIHFKEKQLQPIYNIIK